MTMLRTGLVLLVFVSAEAQPGILTWLTGAETDLCLGTSSLDWLSVMVGVQSANKTCVGSNGPAEYLSITIVGLGASTDPHTYAHEDGTPKPAVLVQGTMALPPMLPRSVDSMTNAPGADYAYRGIGGFVSPMPTWGSPHWYWLGAAVYLLKSGNISTNVNTFAYQLFDPSIGTVSVKTSNVCIATDNGTAGSSCGAARRYVPGALKFTLFGYAAGRSGVSASECAVQVPSGAAASYFGFRMLVKVGSMGPGITTSSVSFNGLGVGLATLGAMPVTSIEVQGKRSSLSITFPARYVTGSLRAYPQFTDMATDSILIHAWPNTADGRNQSFFLDFIVKFTADMKACTGFFVYDPEIAPAASKAATTSASSAAGMPGAAVLAAHVLGLVAVGRLMLDL